MSEPIETVMAGLRRPPLGVMPEWIWLLKHPDPSDGEKVARIHELACGVARYREAGETPPEDWTRELNRLLLTVRRN